MHLLLTDRLTCPRCGPAFGLILLARRLEDRRVFAGALGCSNCRDRFPIEDGFADLRPPPRPPLGPVDPVERPAAAATQQLAALLGVAEGPGHVALIGPLAPHADALAEFIPGIEVVAVDAAARGASERAGVSRLAAGAELPFQPRTFRALATAGASPRADALAHLVARGGRIVVQAPGPGAADSLEAAGLELILRQADWIVALKKTS